MTVCVCMSCYIVSASLWQTPGNSILLAKQWCYLALATTRTSAEFSLASQGNHQLNTAQSTKTAVLTASTWNVCVCACVCKHVCVCSVIYYIYMYVIVIPWARVRIYRQSMSARGITNMFYFSMYSPNW